VNLKNCPHCDATDTKKRGVRKTATGTFQRYQCNSCSKYFSDMMVSQDEEDVEESFVRDDDYINELKSNERLIVTSAQNNAPVLEDFWNCLKTYSEAFDAGIMVIPVRYKTVNSMEEQENIEYADVLKPYLVENRVVFPEHKLVIDGSIRIAATAENPLSGFDPLSKGNSLIVGHAQIQQRTLPRLSEDYPPILSTTGSVTAKRYSATKAGQKAEFNHSFSAMILEFDGAVVHMRHLNYDPVEHCFYDLDTKSTATDFSIGHSIEAIVTGDEHAVFADPVVVEATYGSNGLVSLLKPKYIVRHDELDAYAVSHHHQKSLFTQYSKVFSDMGCITKELDKTIEHVNRTTPSGSTNVIVQSNHNEHLMKWLNEADPRKDLRNAKIYHWFAYHMMDAIDNGTKTPDPFELYSRGKFDVPVIFTNRSDGFSIKGVECGSHGDVGNGGARGNRKSFSILPQKTIIGHSHSPGIEKSCYQTGTSSILRLEYNQSASSWHHAHCLIHCNGKRQMVYITNGKFRA
jgi:transcriptional regulator NrdR family protein